MFTRVSETACGGTWSYEWIAQSADKLGPGGSAAGRRRGSCRGVRLGCRHPEDKAPASRARRTASGRPTPPTSAAPGIRRSIRSTPPISSKLEVAWRFKTDNLGTRPEFKLEGTPLMVKGVLYATAGTRRSVVALDAKTGELIWVHSLREGHARRDRAAAALGPRRVVLDRRQGRRTHPLRDDRLPARRAEREERRSRSRRSARTASSI